MGISVKNLETAPAGSKPVLEAVKGKFSFIPNLMGLFATNPEALKSYLALTETFASSGLSNVEQQVVAISVSRENNCEYCVAAHSAIGSMGGIERKLIDQLRSGERLTDPKLEALRVFTQKVTATRAVIDEESVQNFKAAGYSDEHVMAVLIGVAMKTLSNYANHIGKTPLDEAFAPFAWKK
ncbi:MAG: carboxymuconolactone decarboxylase family protein [Oligoflexales bacterium]